MRLDDLDVEAGEMRHRVTLQELAEVEDAYGQKIKSWGDRIRLWSSVRPLSGRDTVNAGQLFSTCSHAVVMRYNPGVVADPNFRLLFGSRVLNIVAVLNLSERGKKTVAFCTEQVAPRPQ
jgi:SPP1 family predicted phage head-tail adaptor